ncbi:MAG: acetyltransferase [Sphaerochaetaceae bacterium]|nr:acetyltransferase [Sphaerochaetaceae bacterium]
MKKLCIYGCGGMGREIADLSEYIDKWNDIVFVDDFYGGKIIDNYIVYNLKDLISSCSNSEVEFIVATGEPKTRELIYNKLDNLKLNYINIIDSEFRLSKLSSIKSGTIIHRGVICTVNDHIGKGCLINKHVVIGHDVNIGDFTVISPNSTIGGDVNIGKNCFLGSGSIIRNGITIGDNSIIGMGAVVLKDVAANSVIVGNPGKLIRKNISNNIF